MLHREVSAESLNSAIRVARLKTVRLVWRCRLLSPVRATVQLALATKAHMPAFVLVVC